MGSDDRADQSVEEPATHPAARSGRRTGLTGVVAVVAVITVILDQATKAWALHAIGDGQVIHVVGSVLQLQLVRNTGAAFSIGSGNTIVMTAVAVCVILVVLRSARNLGSRMWAVMFGLIVGGAIGNLIDRFARPPGHGRGAVIDFIDYGGLFVGNVADIAIVGAACAVAILAWRGIPLGSGTR